MSLENEEQQHGLVQQAEARHGHESHKKSIISYTREFLLSLSELDVCKKLPSGFDQSILSEFEDVPQDRFRSSGGGLSSQSYRRNEYSSSPPTRGDMGNYSRGNHGRWDSRSSGKSDRDSDSQSDWDSDSGRRYGNQSRRPWQVPEHDGLLGSGSFPRPTGYAAGASAPKFRANDNYQLNRSNEPYHPPRPYKAVPHSRRDTDSYNDETFGSSDCTSEDRAEEERKRRASFELMRKEQHKAFQEKQKLSPEKGKDDFDIIELLEGQKDDKRFLERRNESDEPAAKPASNNDSDKSVFPSPAPVSRPLVPPGFSSTIVERNTGIKSTSHHQPPEVGNELDRSILHAKGNRLLSGTSNNQEEKQFLKQMGPRDQQLGSSSIHAALNKQSENSSTLSSSLDVSSEAVGIDSQYYETSKLSGTFEASENSEVMELDLKNMTGHKAAAGSTPAHSTSILDKLFGNALTLNGIDSSSSIEQHDVKADDIEDPHVAQSSRFAQWFLEEKEPNGDLSSGSPNKPVDDLSSSRPNDLLSLIVGGEKSGSSLVVGGENNGSQDFDVKATENTSSSFPFQGPALADGLLTSNLVPVTIENINQTEAAPAVLTCEDLEQSILSEITESGPVLQPPVQGSSGGSGTKTELQKVDIDDNASQHLLSLLQKGTDLGIISADKMQNIEVENLGASLHNSREIAAENISNSGRPLTLETLFGTAFMKELQSVGTPTPGQRGSVESIGVDVPESLFPLMDNNLLASTPDITSSMPSHGSSLLASNQRQQIKYSERMEKTLYGFDSQNIVNSSQLRTELGSKLGGIDGSVDIRLPEEDSLITASDPLNLSNFMPTRNLAKTELLSTPESAVDIAEKLAALNSVHRDERPIIGGQEGPAFLRGPYDVREPDVQYHKTHAQQSSPLLPPQLNHQGSMFHPLDSHPANVNAQIKFMAPENIIHHDPPNHQFPANLLRPPFHHQSTGPTGLDPSPHNPVLQQMQSPGNFPPPHLLRGFPRGGPFPSHPINQVPGFIQEPNPMQGFPFGQRPPNLGGFGIPAQAPDAGGGTHHPEALQRLIEMELRSKSKPIHPFASAGHSQGMYGHELDTGFGYR